MTGRAALGVLAVVAVAALGWIRLAPSEAARWHVDPAAAPDPGRAGHRVPPGEAVFAAPPEAVLSAFDAVALGAPRTRRLAGGPGQGRITYVSRSRVFGFPDYTTVAALPAGGGTTLAVLGRLRFGQSDTGVNRRRIEGWLAELGARLPGP